MALKFKRIDKCWQNASNHPDTDVDFLLEENNWDDFGFSTTYFLHASSKLTGKEPECLGALRIMRRKQTTDDKYLLDKLFGSNIFSCLPEDFISLSMDVDLYMGLNRWLSNEVDRQGIIKSLRMILGTDSEFFDDSLYSDLCFSNSLLRDGSSLDNFALKKGKALLTGSECIYDLRKEVISVKYSHIEGSRQHLHQKSQ